MDKRQTYYASSLKELEKVAHIFCERNPTPRIFLLKGEMGAGKTTFVKAVCQAFGLDDSSSPTFALANYYNSDSISIYHFDLYRLNSLEEALDFGFDEYLDKKAYLFIEWPELVMSILPKDVAEITIIDNLGVREISF